jgi:hypothetical protein
MIPELTFAVRCSPKNPGYQELGLQDIDGNLALWAISEPLKHLTKRPVLLWHLSASVHPHSLSCLETGPVQLLDAGADSRTALAQGKLRLAFSGQLLCGGYCLLRLHSSSGPVWQLARIGRS